MNRLCSEFCEFIKGIRRRELAPITAPDVWAWTDDDKRLNWSRSLSHSSELTRDSLEDGKAMSQDGWWWASWHLGLALTPFSKLAAMEDAESVEGVDTASTIGQPITFRSGPLAGRLIRYAPRPRSSARPRRLPTTTTSHTPLLTTLLPLSSLQVLCTRRAGRPSW